VKSSVVRELRAVQRFAVTLPVALTWCAPGQPDGAVQGFTRDISTRGMFVLADCDPIPGQLLKFGIDLALDESTPLVLVEGEGRVVRVEDQPPPAQHSSGFAVHNVWFKLREPEEGQAIPPDIQARATTILRPGSTMSGQGRHGGLAIVARQGKTDSN
jgi:PilZ domain